MRQMRLGVMAVGIFGFALATQGWTVTQLTHDDVYDNGAWVSGNNVVWFGFGGPENVVDVFWYDGQSVRQLTDSSQGFSGVWPRIDGSNVVYSGKDGNGHSQIYMYDLSTGIRRAITNNIDGNYEPVVSGSNVAWTSTELGEIYYYNGSTTTRLTYNGRTDDDPEICGNYVVWDGMRGAYSEILLYDGTCVRQISNNSYSNIFAKIHGTTVVWEGSDGQDFEIFMYDILTGTTRQLTNNNYHDDTPVASDRYIAWSGGDAGAQQIFLYDMLTEETRQISTGPDNVGVDLSGSLITWSCWDGNDSEIFVYDITTGIRTQLTDNDYTDLSAHTDGRSIAWTGFDNHDLEHPLGNIFLATVPEPAGIFLILTALPLFHHGVKRRIQ